MTFMETLGHFIAMFVGPRTERGIIFIALVELIGVLELDVLTSPP